MAREETTAAEARSEATGTPVALRRLLVGCDDSAGSARAAAFALALAGATGAHATLLHAGPDPAMTPGHAEAAAAAAEQVMASERAWRTRLAELRERAPAGAEVDVRLEHGSPALALMDAAEATNADLILLGSGGVGPVRGAVLGSVSSQLLQHAPCSVMLFAEGREPAAPAAEAERVVVGIDGSACSRYALRIAQEVAVALGARLVLATAVDPRVAFVRHPPEAVRELLRAGGQQLLDEARASVAASLEAVEEELLEGAPRDALTTLCERHEPALLVVGTRGIGGFKSLLVGSTSQWMVNHAPCPVLVAREPGGDGARA